MPTESDRSNLPAHQQRSKGPPCDHFSSHCNKKSLGYYRLIGISWLEEVIWSFFSIHPASLGGRSPLCPQLIWWH